MAAQVGTTLSTAASSSGPVATASSEPPSSEACHNGCGRSRLRGWPSCCRQCSGADGPHTRACQQRLRAQLAAAAAAAPAPPGVATSGTQSAAAPPPAEGPNECPVCLEEVPLISQAGSCSHLLCQSCVEGLRAFGIRACPLCRGPVSGDPPLEPEEPGYVVLSTPSGLISRLGFHPVTWPVLEARLRVPPGQLAGALSRWGVQLRKVTGRRGALSWWRSRHSSEMPMHP